MKSKENKKNEFFIIAGERRWRASQLAKIHEIPSIIRDDVEDEKIADLSLVENIQRSELNPIEEAEGYQSLINKYNYKQDDVAQAVGKSRSHIANIIRLLSLSELAKDCLIQNKLTIGQIRPLIGHSDCDHLLDIIVKNKLTSRQVEKLVKQGQTKFLKPKPQKEIDIVNLEKELLEITGIKVNINYDAKKNAGSISLDCKNLSEFKEKLSDLLVAEIDPISKEIKKLLEDKSYLDKILLDGVEKANSIALKKIDRIKEIVGF